MFSKLKQIFVIALTSVAIVCSCLNTAMADNDRVTDNVLIIAAVETDEVENLPAAVVWYLELAEQGDMDAQYNLGSIYETGFGVGVDLKKAVKWYKKAARQGHQVSQLKMGLFYYVGNGVRQSTIKGSRWIRESAESGNSLAILLNEEVLAHDAGLEVNQQKLISKVLQAFEKGQINAEETLRLELQKLDRKKKIAEKKPRFAGNVTGSAAKPGTVKNEIPGFLDKTRKPVRLTDNSLDSIKHRAKEGVATAQYKLATLYENGDQTEQDKTEAFKWYTAAASQNNADAQYRLALAYLYGEGTEQSTASAGVWLVKARKQKHLAATELLKHISSNQAGTIDKPHSILLTWYIENSLDGDGEAMMGLGYMYQNGWGVDPDPKMAKQWLTKARAAGVKGAARQLRRMKSGSEAVNKTGVVQREPVSPTLGNGSDATLANLNETDNELSRLGTHDDPSAMNDSTVAIYLKSIGAELEQLIGSETLNNLKAMELSKFKSYLTPVSLLILGLFMGMIVFRWMRSGQKRNSVF